MPSNLCVRSARGRNCVVGALLSSPPAHAELLEPRRLMSSTTTLTEAPYGGDLQVRITGTDGDDQITVGTDSNGALLVTNSADGSVLNYSGVVKTIRVDGGTGNDTVTIDWTVTARTFLYGGDGDDTLVGGRENDYLSGGAGTNTLDGGDGDDVLVTVGGGVTDRLTGGAGDDSFWLDSKRSETISDLEVYEAVTGRVHRIGSFFSRVKDPAARTAMGNVALGATDLADPAVTDSDFVYSNFADYPLFGDGGPLPDDVKQGSVGDCYSMVVLSSVAGLDPNKLRQSVVDLGDGTYAVQFRRSSGRYYVRVDADLPVYSWSADPAGGRGAGGVPVYAGLGEQNALWVALIEKAHAVVRTLAGGYAGLDAGWMREGYGLLGSRSRSFVTADADVLMRTIQVLLGAGRSVTYATNDPAPGTPLLGNHAYSVVGVNTDALGNAVSLRLRNPWGVDGAGNDGNDDGYVTVTAQQALGALAGVCTAVV